MFSQEEIEEIVNNIIKQDEKLGEQVGGSGHLAHNSYKIDKIETEILIDNRLRINYNYTTYIETEFTCYPDNPPYEYQHSGSIVINDNKNII